MLCHFKIQYHQLISFIALPEFLQNVVVGATGWWLCTRPFSAEATEGMAWVRSKVGERWSRFLFHIAQQDLPKGNSRRPRSVGLIRSIVLYIILWRSSIASMFEYFVWYKSFQVGQVDTKFQKHRISGVPRQFLKDWMLCEEEPGKGIWCNFYFQFPPCALFELIL